MPHSTIAAASGCDCSDCPGDFPSGGLKTLSDLGSLVKGAAVAGWLDGVPGVAGVVLTDACESRRQSRRFSQGNQIFLFNETIALRFHAFTSDGVLGHRCDGIGCGVVLEGWEREIGLV